MDADRLAALHVPVTQLNTDPGFGGECHLDANMVRSALPRAAARRDRPAGDRERRQPRLPGRVPGRRGRARDGLLGHRGRGQAAQVPAHVPRLRAGAGQQDRPAPAPRLRPRRASSTTSTRCIPASSACSSARRRARASTSGATGSRAVGARAEARRVTQALARTPARRLERAARASAREANATFFDAEAERLARLCHRMAERFARGGRLVALGRSPAARSDARHVAVEFVHPVIVGKRALPAIGARRRGRDARRQVELLAEPDDIAIAFGADEDGGEAAARSPRASAAASRSRSRRPAPSGSSSRRADDPFVRQELVETLYHVLWELVHVFFDHRGLLEGRDARPVHDTGASSFLYPFLGRERARPRGGASTTCARSVLMKAEEVGELRDADAHREPRRAARGRRGAAREPRRGRQAARARQRRLGHRRDGRGRRLPPPARPALAGAAGARPHRGPGDPDRDRERHRHRGDLPAPGDRLRRARATRCSRSPPAATRRT